MKEIEIPINDWVGLVLVVILISFGIWTHHLIFYHNPKLAETIHGLESRDPRAIGEALLKAREVSMERGHKLVPSLLPLLQDERSMPDDIVNQFSQTRGFLGMSGIPLPKIEKIGTATGLVLQSLVINDVTKERSVSGAAKEKIVDYVLQRVAVTGTNFEKANALMASNHIFNQRLIPFRFQCLASDDDALKVHALSGIFFYVTDRSKGIFPWNPSKEINEDMKRVLSERLNDSSLYVRRQSEEIIGILKKMGMEF